MEAVKEVYGRLAVTPITKLSESVQVKDPRIVAQMNMLGALCVPAFFFDQTLFGLISAIACNLALHHGTHNNNNNDNQYLIL